MWIAHPLDVTWSFSPKCPLHRTCLKVPTRQTYDRGYSRDHCPYGHCPDGHGILSSTNWINIRFAQPLPTSAFKWSGSRGTTSCHRDVLRAARSFQGSQPRDVSLLVTGKRDGHSVLASSKCWRVGRVNWRHFVTFDVTIASRCARHQRHRDIRADLVLTPESIPRHQVSFGTMSPRAIVPKAVPLVGSEQK